ncbi:MAG: 23S rRNA (pseudouridine(1915)-N(3))-methyltransferase RlmH [Bacteroidales bacterium]
MKIKLILIGKTSFDFISDGLGIFQNRLKHFCDFEIVNLQELKNAKNMPVDEIKKKEGQMLGKVFGINEFICLLDENGTQFDSEKFAGFISNKAESGIKSVSFVVGGAYGFSEEIYKRADYKLSLSKMTFSHQLIRLIFMEQLYRAFTIIKGLPYHNQ